MNQISKNENEEKRNYTKIVITNSNQYLPSDLSIQAYSLLIPIYLKETCFGLVITGTKENVDNVCQKLQKLDENHIFIKDRGFPAGDKRRCRATRNGGSRPGFYKIYKEIQILQNISNALESNITNKKIQFKEKKINKNDILNLIEKYNKKYISLN